LIFHAFKTTLYAAEKVGILGMLVEAKDERAVAFYEGFGLPILEAQIVGVPVVTSNVSSIPEVVGNSALLIDPKKPSEIAEAIYKILSNEEIKKDIINRGLENIKRF